VGKYLKLGYDSFIAHSVQYSVITEAAVRPGQLSRYSDWLRAGRPRFGVQIPVESRIFSIPRFPDHILDPPSHLSNGHRGVRRPERVLTTYLQLVPR
jgi:hypothetical protein